MLLGEVKWIELWPETNEKLLTIIIKEDNEPTIGLGDKVRIYLSG